MGLDSQDHEFWPWDVDPDYEPHQRASGLNAAKICPGSMFLGQAERLRRRDNTTADTTVGTIGHRWLELQIQMGREVAASYLNGKLDLLPDGFSTTLDELWSWLCDESELLYGDGAEVLTEQEISVRLGPCRLVGHADLIQIAGRRGAVIDWKFYNNLSMLPSMHEDLQMFCYGLGTLELAPDISEVEIHRVLCYDRYCDTMILSRDSIETAREALGEVVDAIWQGRKTFVPGANCTTCLLRRACPAYRTFECAVDTSEIAPYRSGEIVAEKDALAFLLAAGQVAERIEQGKEACRRFVEAHGPIKDPVSGKQWGPGSSQREAVQDPAAAIGALGKAIGGDMASALSAASATKGSIEKVLKSHKVPPADRKEFFVGLRDRDVLAQVEGSPRWQWRKSRQPSE